MRVLVVGAGIIGAALADRLTRPASGAPVRVTVVEAEAPGAGTSGTSYAWINANDPADPAYHRFRTAAMSAWRDLAAGFGDPAWYRPSGNVTWAADDGARERLAGRVARLSGLGYAADLITSDRFRRLEPHAAAPPDALIAHYPGEAHLHGGPAARALALRARDSGAELVTGRRAVRLNTGGDRVTGVRLDDGRDLDADLTVCAAGRHSPALLATAGVGLPVVDPSEPGSAAPCLVATTSPAQGALNGLVHAPGLSARPAENGGLVLEADDLDAGIDESASPALIQEAGRELLARARALVPALTAEVAEVRRCVRPLPVDGYPLIGFQRPGLYTAVTHSGITLAPHLAALVAEEIAGRPSPELAPYRPDRPDPAL
ncbi:glycine/D-amino acid oxidase-like deaminating enzyme [Actinomadura coerulea]|uniref:Glycine/D-amino acid oxidase-like deaminating enzyme n=1 Tax=Actinomadura coerulea TaxID=46159 RepID=A0A7X0KYV5_9ACTN|nr:glycine/D-amino acid oxidase-like deaminating enzyme [Actinomadura coerulea]GGQ27268.1 D-amino-acid oxidase [Actinomadura coerulea]